MGRNFFEKVYFVTYRNDVKFVGQCPQIKFYWHTVVPVCLQTIYGCVLDTGRWEVRPLGLRIFTVCLYTKIRGALAYMMPRQCKLGQLGFTVSSSCSPDYSRNHYHYYLL